MSTNFFLELAAGCSFWTAGSFNSIALEAERVARAGYILLKWVRLKQIPLLFPTPLGYISNVALPLFSCGALFLLACAGLLNEKRPHHKGLGK